MVSAEVRAAYGRLTELAARSALAYATGDAKLSLVDDADRAVDALLRESVAKEAHYVAATAALGEAERMAPIPRPFALRTSYLNFARAASVAARLPAQLEGEAAALDAVARVADDGSTAAGRVRAAAKDLAALRREAASRLAALLATLRPAPSVAAPVAPAATPAKPAAPAAPAAGG